VKKYENTSEMLFEVYISLFNMFLMKLLSSQESSDESFPLVKAWFEFIITNLFETARNFEFHDQNKQHLCLLVFGEKVFRLNNAI
jgi:hypothetical protein